MLAGCHARQGCASGVFVCTSDVHKEGSFRSTRLPEWFSNGKTEHDSDG